MEGWRKQSKKNNMEERRKSTRNNQTKQNRKNRSTEVRTKDVKVRKKEHMYLGSAAEEGRAPALTSAPVSFLRLGNPTHRRSSCLKSNTMSSGRCHIDCNAATSS